MDLINLYVDQMEYKWGSWI